MTLTFIGEDGDQITGVLSAYGQTIIFGYSEFDNTEKYTSLGIGAGVKGAATRRAMSPGAMFLLLSQ